MKKSIGIFTILILNGLLLNISEAGLSITSQQCIGYGETPVNGAPPRMYCCPRLEEFRLPSELMGGAGACARVACDTKAYGKWGVLNYRIRVIHTDKSIQVLRVDENNKEKVLIMDYRDSAHLDRYSSCRSELREGSNKISINMENNKTVISLEREGVESFNNPYFECSDPEFTKLVMHKDCINNSIYIDSSSKQGSSRQ